MIEVPSLLFELDHVLPEADFVSIGSNDLIMFLNAADRANNRVSPRPTTRSRCRACARCGTSSTWPSATACRITMCGELAGRTVEALALMAIGMTRLSMSPPAIGPIKEMVLGMELEAHPRRRRRRAAAKASMASASASCCWTWPSSRASLI